MGYTAFVPPRAMIVNYEIVTSYYICSQLLGQNLSFYAETEYLCDYIHLRSSAKTEVSHQVDDESWDLLLSVLPGL